VHVDAALDGDVHVATTAGGLKRRAAVSMGTSATAGRLAAPMARPAPACRTRRAISPTRRAGSTRWASSPAFRPSTVSPPSWANTREGELMSSTSANQPFTSLAMPTTLSFSAASDQTVDYRAAEQRELGRYFDAGLGKPSGMPR